MSEALALGKRVDFSTAETKSRETVAHELLLQHTGAARITTLPLPRNGGALLIEWKEAPTPLEDSTRVTRREARGRAEKVILEAKSGSDFAKLAASYSDAPDALAGGQMGWRPQDRLPELFAAALKDMRPGDWSVFWAHLAFGVAYNLGLLTTMIWLFNRRWRVSQ